MKSILFIFFLIFIQLSWAQLPSIPLDLSKVQSNPQLQGLLYIAVQNVTQQAIQDGALPEGYYQFSQLIQAAQSQDDDYRFEVEISDSQDSTATIEFFISYDSSEGTFEVTSYSVLNDNEEEDDGYTELSSNVINTNPQIRGLLMLGVQNVTNQAIKDGALIDGDYQLARVNGVEGSRTNLNNYRFDVNLQSTTDSKEFRVVFVLLYDSENGVIEVLSYRIEDDNDENGEGEFGEIGEGGEQTEDGFVILDPSVAFTDPLIYGIISLGLQKLTNDSTYELIDVYSIEQGIENPDNYRFDVSARFGLGDIMRLELDILYDNTANSVELISFEFPERTGLPAGYQEIEFEDDPDSIVYRVGDTGFKAAALRGYLDGTIPAGDYTVIEVHGVSKKVEEGVEYYRFDVEATDGASTAARFV